MAKFDDKISHLISQQAPDFVLDDHPYFLEFVKAYYTFMESAELTLTNIGDPDVIQLETQTGTISLLQIDGTNQQGLYIDHASGNTDNTSARLIVSLPIPDITWSAPFPGVILSLPP